MFERSPREQTMRRQSGGSSGPQSRCGHADRSAGARAGPPADRAGSKVGIDPPRPGTVKFTARCRSLPQTQLLAGRLDVAETARRGEPRYQLNALIHLCRGLTSSALRLVCQQSEPSRHRWEWDQLHVRKRSKWDPRGVCDHATARRLGRQRCDLPHVL